jgi:DNA sulfur modification protein DndC
MIQNGYKELEPLYKFRNWLTKFRENTQYRCQTRRNGKMGLGPITLKGRKIILSKLLRTQSECKIKLILDDEVNRIKELWKIDRINSNYFES